MQIRSQTSFRLLASLVVLGLVSGGWYVYKWNARQLRIGDYRVDPMAKLDPNRRYDVLVWEHDLYIPGLTPDRRRAALEAAAAELAEVYPNIAVHFEFRNPEESVEQLRQALEAGVGPDVIALLGGFYIDPSRQVPITPYVSEEARADMVPSVVTALQHDGHLWAWPRWVSLSVWLGQARSLKDVPGLPALSAHDLVSYGAQWRSALGNRPPIALNALDPDLVYDILVSSTGHSLLSGDGTIQWTREAIETAGQLLATMTTEGLLSKDTEHVARNRLRLFWEGQATMIAPVPNPLLHHALSRLGEIMHDTEDGQQRSSSSELRVASPPYIGDHLEGMPGQVAGYGIFLRETHAGHDHTLAVMLVAQHLSRRAGYWEAANMLTVPAHASSLSQWERDSGMDSVHVQSLIELSSRLVPPPVGTIWHQLQREALDQAVRPHVNSLLQGTLTPEQFSELVWRDLQSLMSARTGK